MGLGLHGGGLATARWLARHGAMVTVTDLKDETALADSVEKLQGSGVRLVLGRHDEQDFTQTDLVVKNPGVPRTARPLTLAGSRGIPIETDISLFLQYARNPVTAVTGSKGKSTTASAIHHGLLSRFPHAALGGNITVSPLSFLDELPAGAPVVLELSSWQLADLPDPQRLKAVVSLITNILPDHMNHYRSMDDYVADKKRIYLGQTAADASLFNLDDPYSAQFQKESPARHLFFSRTPLPHGFTGAWLEEDIGRDNLDGDVRQILPRNLRLAGEHNRLNLLAAALALRVLGLESREIGERLAAFSGIEHRFEFVGEQGGVRFINDSAATIPHAALEAVRSVPGPIILMTGGTDKNIDFAPLAEVAAVPKTIILLEGSATGKIISLLDGLGIGYHGPFSSLADALSEAVRTAKPGDTILFSPGCASFGMFQNEFDRGRRFKSLATSLFPAARASESK
ncbi:MAG TPA: UDP-N-acetylmuramoyl-L-alanine--D-glutamate ligase [Spirochaetia bacterium]|nr:UDP-N-acetylmuramoyl-L-alanine--D-glutamate ligase [Spirochaetia bacterium]